VFALIMGFVIASFSAAPVHFHQQHDKAAYLKQKTELCVRSIIFMSFRR